MRAAYILMVRPGKEEQYRRAHQAVWPELIEEANKAGIRNHSVFMHGRTLFVYLEADDIGQAERKLKQTAVKQRWDAYMGDLLEPGAVPLEEVFYMK